MSSRTLMLVVSCALAFEVAPARADVQDDLRKEARRVPKKTDEALDLARRLRRAGLYDDGIRVARAALASARGTGPVGDLFLEVARGRIAQRNQKAAFRECARLDKIDDTKRHVCVAEVELLRRRGSLALPAAEAVLKSQPNHYDATVAKGRALAQLGKPALAEAALRAAVAREPKRSEAYRALARLLLDQRRTRLALEALRTAKKWDPTQPDVLLLLGEHATDATEAVAALRAAIASRPSEALAHALLGKRLRQQGDARAAERSLDAALKLDPQQADWHAELGNVYLAQKRADDALRAARAALKIVANHAGARLVEANALAAKGDIDLAIAAYEAASGLASRDPTPLVDAATACAKHGRPTTARAFAERVTEEFPSWGPGWVALGDVAVAAGDRADARAAYKKALSVGGPVDRKAVQKKLAAIR